MDFEKKLDQFVERGADKVADHILNEKDCTCEFDYDNCPYNHKEYDAVLSYNLCADSLKPIVLKLYEYLNKRKAHHECEDGWYSCPKSEYGCLDEGAGKECNCGADEIIKTLAEASKMIEGGGV